MNDRELSWAAGLFEGEGTVRINAPTARSLGALLVSVVNTDRQIVDFFQERWPAYMKPATGLRPEQRPAWVWVISSRQAARFLRAIEPFIVTERMREKIRHGLEFQDQKVIGARGMEYAEQQFNGWLYMRTLNVRGNPDRPHADKVRAPRKRSGAMRQT